MGKICIIIPYFGKLPSNIYTFLLSCKYNKNINWLIFTDQKIDKYNELSLNNVKFINSTLSIIRNRIKVVTGLNHIDLDRPYKLNDYKPLYGLVFSKYLYNCNYWGYSDMDIVYGNLYKYICYGITNNYDKIGVNGHLTLFKNASRINNLYKLPIINKNGRKVYLFRDIVSCTHRACAFDEFGGIDIICNQYNIRTYVNDDLVNDLLYENMDLNTNDRRFFSKYSCYIWHNGHAYYFYMYHGNIFMHEYGYFHFQKRLLFRRFINNLNNIQTFSITTYGYNKINHFNKNSVILSMRFNKSSIIHRLKYICHWYFMTSTFTRIHIGKIYFPLKYILWRIIVRKDFKI